MKTTVDFRKQFLTDRDESGRFIVTSYRTGRTYFVEPIDESGRPADWGSYNPGSGKIENKKGFDKYTGSIPEIESMITKENGFENIKYSGVGSSPFSKIEEMDSKYPDKIK